MRSPGLTVSRIFAYTVLVVTTTEGLIRGAVVRKGDPRLEAVNRGLAALERNGTLASLRQHWVLAP